MSVSVTALSEAIGAEVLGVDLRKPPSTDLALLLNQSLLEHIVLVVRDQTLTSAEFVAAMKTFGTPARQNQAAELMGEHPEIAVMDSREAPIGPDGNRLLGGADSWHTDHTNLLCPPKLSVLYAVQIPPSGGDTCFANAYLMYERLPAQTRERISRLKTVNGADRHLPLEDSDRDAFSTPAVHPLVRRHPETGRRALYCHPLKTQYIEGMDPGESFAFIDQLWDSALTSDVIYRHRWRLGDLAFIDNRACLHRAQRDYDPEVGRIMHRIIIEGDQPVS